VFIAHPIGLNKSMMQFYRFTAVIDMPYVV
jgi:hypothetical protein